ncbi:MAG: 23S rRNA 5-hydroxycytidine synthase [Desulfovibrio sp.]
MAFVPELLVPAGNPEKFYTAVLYGADAVYLGGVSGNLRASSGGFSQSDLAGAVAHARAHGVKIYYCLNALPFENDMKDIPKAAEAAAEAGVDAFIVADPGVFSLAKRVAPHISIHLSTQANTTNAAAVNFWLDAGFTRVNLARELSCKDITAVRETLPHAELEVFVHGAMCLAVSGQCLLSAWLNNRPANQGRCTQPCRFEYRATEATIVLEEALRGGERLWDIDQGERYAAFFAPDDLCLLPFLPWFIRNEITSLKIEGRMKGASYVAHVTDAYRSALDACLEAEHGILAGKGMFAWRSFLPDLERTASRPLSTGFFLPKRRYISSGGAAPRPLAAKVLEEVAPGAWLVDVRGKWDAAKDAELMLPGMRRPTLESGSYTLENHRGERVSVVNSGMRAVVHSEAESFRPGIFIRVKE